MIWVGRLIAVAVCLQTLELFWIKPWNWTRLRGEIPWIWRPWLQCNGCLLFSRLMAAVLALAFPNPLWIGIVWLATWGVAIRWRGTFNGGSDAMTFQILLAWLVFSLFPQFEGVCLLYVVLQLILSYGVAGWAKLINPEWRRGEALLTFLRDHGIEVSPRFTLVASWILIGFEIGFGFALVMPWPFVAVGLLFHLTNTYVFGLNRFFFVWLAAYPALLNFDFAAVLLAS